MYAPLLQSSSTDAGTTLQCVYLIVAIIIAAIILASLASKTKNAPPYSRPVTTTLSRAEVVKMVERFFPKSIVVSSFNWKSSWVTPERMAITGYYVTNGQGCLVMLLTGIIPGALLIWLAMGRTEKVIVDFAKFQGTGELTLEAKGLRARREVDALAPKLGIPGTPNEHASPTVEPLPIPTAIAPLAISGGNFVRCPNCNAKNYATAELCEKCGIRFLAPIQKNSSPPK